MALVVLIEDVTALDEFDGYAEQEMRRWWNHRCRKHSCNGEVFFDVGEPKRFRLYEGVKRLASFGVRARVARRKLTSLGGQNHGR